MKRPFRLEMIRAGLYEIVGQKCGCGGRLHTERLGRGEFT